ncbi:MAG TPA: MBL fold metallo-hydrolase, partial [Polyangia bacterium]
MEIYPNVHQIHQMFVNMYLVVDANGLLLIDTGINGSRGRILQALQVSGHSLAELKSIFITHADGDHYGGLAVLQQDSQATTYADPIEAQAIRAGVSSRPLNPKGAAKLFFALVTPVVK